MRPHTHDGRLIKPHKRKQTPSSPARDSGALNGPYAILPTSGNLSGNPVLGGLPGGDYDHIHPTRDVHKSNRPTQGVTLALRVYAEEVMPTAEVKPRAPERIACHFYMMGGEIGWVCRGQP